MCRIWSEKVSISLAQGKLMETLRTISNLKQSHFQLLEVASHGHNHGNLVFKHAKFIVNLFSTCFKCFIIVVFHKFNVLTQKIGNTYLYYWRLYISWKLLEGIWNYWRVSTHYLDYWRQCRGKIELMFTQLCFNTRYRLYIDWQC